MNTRRTFLKNGGLALFGMGIGGIPNFVKAAVAEQKFLNKKKVLVCIFQRGAMDGLMAVSPFNDLFLKKARPSLFLEPSNAKSFIDLDGRFGLHPSFKNFESLFKSKQLAIVHGMGSPNKTRSHFDAQDYMESGTPFKKGTDSGWLNRILEQKKVGSSVFQGVSLTNSLPRSFYGENPCLAIANLSDFKINKNSGKTTISAAKSFEELYDITANDLQKQTSKESFEAIRIIEKLNFKNYSPINSAKYPASPLGNSLKQIAQLIKSDVGLEVAFAESTGWDTHFNQGKEVGIFARNAEDLGNSINALWQDIAAFQDDVMIMTMTEFGRTVKQNGTNGTDHGRASCSFILGNSLLGGKVYEKIPDLAIENLEDGRDLPVSIDFRSVFNEVASKHLKIKDPAKLFPDWSGENLSFLK